jgi:predicted nuclease with TOPRIM domain
MYVEDPVPRTAIDPARIPTTTTHEEARRRLTEAYAEIRSLRTRIARLEKDRRDLTEERDKYKVKYKIAKKENDD